MSKAVKQGPCEYCGQNGALVVQDPECFVCGGCKKLLKNPATAFPLMRGHLTLKLRGTLRQDTLDRWLNDYMALLASLRPKN